MNPDDDQLYDVLTLEVSDGQVAVTPRKFKHLARLSTVIGDMVWK
jgi:hypothetical protein